MTTGYIFTTDKLLNPRKSNPYYERGNGEQVCYVVSREGSILPKAFTSYGEIQGWTLGSQHRVVSDQTGRNLGFHEIVGIVRADGSIEGEVPNRQMAHGVFK